MARTFASRFAWVSCTPLGLPVEPEVYCNNARSAELASDGTRGAATPRASIFGEQVRRRDNILERRHFWTEQLGYALGFAKSDQQARFRVVQDRGLALGVFRDAIGTDRRIDRYRNAAGQQYPGKGQEEFARGRQHQGYRVSAPDPSRSQPGGHRLCSVIQFGERDALRFGVVFPENQMLARAAGVRPMAKHLLPGFRPQRAHPMRLRPCAGSRPIKGATAVFGDEETSTACTSVSAATTSSSVLASATTRSGRVVPKSRPSRTSNSTRSRLPSPRSRSSCADPRTASCACCPPSSSSRSRVTAKTCVSMLERSGCRA